MEENKNNNSPRKKRPRIVRSTTTTQNGTFRQNVVTTSQNREHIASRSTSDIVALLREIARFPEDFCRKKPQEAQKLLSNIVSPQDKSLLFQKPLAIIQKYKNAIWRKYIYLAAKKDIENLLTANPQPLPAREEEVKLECMEQLKMMLERGKIRPEQYQYIQQTHFPDIISKDNLPQAQVSKMLRSMAAGRFYAPFDNKGNIDSKKFSAEFAQILAHPKQHKISAKIEDYDFFGLDETKQPKSPIWYAVKDSRNFQKLKPLIAKRCIEKGIPPQTAYKLNTADLWALTTPDQKPHAVKFSEICPQINNAPFEEFSQKLGLILSVGGGKEISYDEKAQIWLKKFASHQEKEDYEDKHSPDLRLFIQKCERIYQKLEQDFKQNHIHPKFMPQWIDSMLKNKSINPSLVACPHKPFKIDIHHWDRLSSVQNMENLSEKNTLENFGVMIMYNEYDFDIHAQEHKGESAHFVLADREEKALDKNRRFLFATSNCLYIGSDLMQKTTDYQPRKEEIYSFSRTANRQRA